MSPASANPLPQSRSPTFIFVALTLATLAFGLVFLTVYRSALKEASIQPEVIFGGPIPDSYAHAMAFQADGGSIAQMVHVPSNTKISIAISDQHSSSATELPAKDAEAENRSGAAIGEVGVMKLLRTYQGVRSHPERLTPLISSFLASQIDARRAVDINSGVISFKEKRLAVERFVGKNNENFLLTVASVNGRQVAIVLMAISRKIPLQLAEEIFSEMPLLSPLITESAPTGNQTENHQIDNYHS